MPVSVVYLILLLSGVLVTVIAFEAKGIENNTATAMKVISLTLLGMSFATGGYAFENKNISKWQPSEGAYRISKISILGASFNPSILVPPDNDPIRRSHCVWRLLLSYLSATQKPGSSRCATRNSFLWP